MNEKTCSPEDIFTAALLAVGPPRSFRGNSENANEHVKEYNEFATAALGRESVTTRVSYAAYSLWHRDRGEYEKLLELWKDGDDLIVPMLQAGILR